MKQVHSAGHVEPFSSHRVAVIGSGVAGLGACWHLRQQSAQTHVTLFEAGSHFGGHAHTLDMTLEGMTHGVDTGFLVYNERTYPALIDLFEQLQVPTAASDMSFSVQVTQDGAPGLEWSGSNLSSVFAQRRNLVRPSFWGMLADIMRFNKIATDLALANHDAKMAQSVADFLRQHGFGLRFQNDYLLPMIGCIWSCPVEQMLQFPMATLIRFCHNHGLLQVSNRPQWYTVQGGSRHYVEKIVAMLDDARLNTPVQAVERTSTGVRMHSERGSEDFDAVVFACHPNQTLALLGVGASASERAVLGVIRYQPNVAVLHTDVRMLPKRPNAWAAWNYERASSHAQTHAPVCLHYLLNRLQPLPWKTPVLVSLNPLRTIERARIHAEINYDHPVFDAPAMAAQQQVPALQGHLRTWFCGAWCGYGFHEDGLKSGLSAAKDLLAKLRASSAQHGAMPVARTI